MLVYPLQVYKPEVISLVESRGKASGGELGAKPPYKNHKPSLRKTSPSRRQPALPRGPVEAVGLLDHAADAPFVGV